jgi:hypothetical protein
MSLKQNYDLSEKDCPVYENYVHAEVCAEIERELAASQAESESRRQSLAFALNEIKKSEAEVDRLDQMVEWFIENAPHFTLAQFNEHQRTLNSTDK